VAAPGRTAPTATHSAGADRDPLWRRLRQRQGARRWQRKPVEHQKAEGAARSDDRDFNRDRDQIDKMRDSQTVDERAECARHLHAGDPRSGGGIEHIAAADPPPADPLAPPRLRAARALHEPRLLQERTSRGRRARGADIVGVGFRLQTNRRALDALPPACRHRRRATTRQ